MGKSHELGPVTYLCEPLQLMRNASPDDKFNIISPQN